MQERKYTLSEIDRIRVAVDRSYSYEYGGSYRAEERVKAVEEQSRTYLIAGIGPEEVEEKLRLLGEKLSAAIEAENRLRGERRLQAEYGPKA